MASSGALSTQGQDSCPAAQGRWGPSGRGEGGKLSFPWAPTLASSNQILWEKEPNIYKGPATSSLLRNSNNYWVRLKEVAMSGGQNRIEYSQSHVVQTIII